MSKKTTTPKEAVKVKCRLLKAMEFGEAVMAPGESINLPVDKAKALESAGKLEIVGA